MFAVLLFELTLREIVNDVPRDLGALLAYTLLLAFVVFIIYGSRSTTNGDDSGLVTMTGDERE